MNFKEFVYTDPAIKFEKLREESIKDSSPRDYEVSFIDTKNNFVKKTTTATSNKEALQNVIYRAFGENLLIGFKSVGYAMGAIMKNVSRFQVSVKDLKYNISFKGSKLKNTLN